MGVTTCDVLVIGAGIAGCTVACELAGAGARVVVVERGAVCSGSSALNAGGIRQQFSQETSVRAGMETVRRLATFEEDFGIDPVFRQAGYLFLHDGGDSGRTLEQAVRVQNACGVQTRLIGPDEVARLVPGINVTDIAGGAHNPTDGYVDPNSMVAGFAAGARARGAVILQESRVTAIETRGNRVTGVTTASGEIASDVVLNAAGAWAPGVAALYGGSLPITARRNDIFVLDRSPARGRFLPLTIDLITGLYMHSEGDGLVAGPAESFAVANPPDNVAVGWEVLPLVVERLVHRLPMLESAQVTHGWAGFIEATPDDNPVVGWTHLDNVYTMAGFSGHGMGLAPGLAPHVARELRGEVAELSLDIYRLERFERGDVAPESIWGGSGIAAGMAARGGKGVEVSKIESF
jgi:glycine/D-amino acid oxidase-like deaminating enzyme